jgi:hypothetical protein
MVASIDSTEVVRVDRSAHKKGNFDGKQLSVRVPGELLPTINLEFAAKFFGGGRESHYWPGCADSVRFAIVRRA